MADLSQRHRERQQQAKRKGSGPANWTEVDPALTGDAIVVGVPFPPTARNPRNHYRKGRIVEASKRDGILIELEPDSPEGFGSAMTVMSLKSIKWWRPGMERETW